MPRHNDHDDPHEPPASTSKIRRFDVPSTHGKGAWTSGTPTTGALGASLMTDGGK